MEKGFSKGNFGIIKCWFNNFQYNWYLFRWSSFLILFRLVLDNLLYFRFCLDFRLFSHLNHLYLWFRLDFSFLDFWLRDSLSTHLLYLNFRQSFSIISFLFFAPFNLDLWLNFWLLNFYFHFYFFDNLINRSFLFVFLSSFNCHNRWWFFISLFILIILLVLSFGILHYDYWFWLFLLIWLEIWIFFNIFF